MDSFDTQVSQPYSIPEAEITSSVNSLQEVDPGNASVPGTKIPANEQFTLILINPAKS